MSISQKWNGISHRSPSWEFLLSHDFTAANQPPPSHTCLWPMMLSLISTWLKLQCRLICCLGPWATWVLAALRRKENLRREYYLPDIEQREEQFVWLLNLFYQLNLHSLATSLSYSLVWCLGFVLLFVVLLYAYGSYTFPILRMASRKNH